jgi:hypothetical protein
MSGLWEMYSFGVVISRLSVPMVLLDSVHLGTRPVKNLPGGALVELRPGLFFLLWGQYHQL